MNKNIAAYEEQSNSVVEHANSLKIIDDETRTQASEFVVDTRRCIKAIEGELKPDIQKAHELHKGLLTRLNKLTEPFKSAQRIVDSEISRDFMERERARLKAEAEARRIAEEAEAERLRLEQEAIDAVEEDVDTAINIMEQAKEIEVVPVIESPTVGKTDTSHGSTTMRKTITVECMDKMAVIRAVAIKRLPLDFITINIGVAKHHATVNKLTSMAGFRIEETAVVSGRVG